VVISLMTNNVGIADSPGGTAWKVVASYSDYEAAQGAVDRLSDASFPVEYVEIVGRDLRFVERVTGRVTKLRAAGVGAGSGAWFGLFIGLLVGLFTTGPAWLGLTLGGLVIGAVAGGFFGFVAQWATHGRRDFASTRGLAAGQYDVMAADGQAERASALLAT
jgi:Heat induced stress protein YflT domain